MDGKNHAAPADGDSKWDSVDFRHLSAFQRVYQEKHYANAGQGIFTTRKSIVRMMRNLERSFDCDLFSEGLRGELVPSAFAERLHNDLRFLNAARHRMKDHIAAIHENGRILHVGSSTAVFRTSEFRNLFRELQALDGIRACYSPIHSADAGKALVSGNCDLYIGCWAGTGNRFVTQGAGAVAFRLYQRKPNDATPDNGGNTVVNSYIVSLDGQIPKSGAPSDETGKWQPLDDSLWLYWLDHPEECPGGTRILGPDVQIDSERWEVRDESRGRAVSQPLQASFLRQHPYEFLPMLVGKIQNRSIA